MKVDLTGRELSVGDDVILTHFWKGCGLGFGKVTRIAGGYAQVRYPYRRDIRDTDRYVLKVNREDYSAQFAVIDERINEEDQREEDRRQQREMRRNSL